jgi:hypothetical protein
VGVTIYNSRNWRIFRGNPRSTSEKDNVQKQQERERLMSDNHSSIRSALVQFISLASLLIAPRVSAAEYTQSMDGQGFVFNMTQDPNSMSGTFENSWGGGVSVDLDPAGRMFFPAGTLLFAGGLFDGRLRSGNVFVGFGLTPFYDGAAVIDFNDPENPPAMRSGARATRPTAMRTGQSLMTPRLAPNRRHRWRSTHSMPWSSA